MDAKIIDIVRSTFDLSEDIEQFKKEIERAEHFSAEKVHLQMLLAEICANESASDNDRMEAARILIDSSDLLAAIQSVPNYQILIDKLIQAARNGSVRH